MAITQADIERAYGPGGTEGTNYTVTLTTNGALHICTVTDDDAGDAMVTSGRSAVQAEAITLAGAGEPLSMLDNIDTAARIRSPSVGVATSGALVIDASAGNNQSATLTANVTSVALINPPPTGKSQQLCLVLEQGPGGVTLPVAAWTGVDWFENVGGAVPEMPPIAGQTLLVRIYMDGTVPIAIGNWANNE